MADLGLFPLQLVLLPTEQAPLHIFEPRYKELIGECIDEDREFGLVLVEEEQMRSIGTRARVTQVLEESEDGRMNIVVEGGERFRLLELTEGRSFQTGNTETFTDEPTDVDVSAAERAIAQFRRVAELAEAEAEPPAPSTQLSFALAARVELPLELKQELLESRWEPERLQRLTQALEGIVELLQRRRELRDLGSRNGHKRL